MQARRHLLVLARSQGLDCLADVGREHLPLLRTMHTVGLKWAEKFISEEELLVFRLGYHSVCNSHSLFIVRSSFTFPLYTMPKPEKDFGLGNFEFVVGVTLKSFT